MADVLLFKPRGELRPKPDEGTDYYELWDDALSLAGGPPRCGDFCLVRLGEVREGEAHMVQKPDGQIVCGYLHIEGRRVVLEFPNPAYPTYTNTISKVEIIGVIETFFCRTAGEPFGGLYLAIDREEKIQPPGGLHLFGEFSGVPLSDMVNWRADADGNITSASDTWEHLTGRPGSEVLGCGFLDFVHPDKRETTRRRWARAVATGRVFTNRCRLMARGEWVETQIIAAKVRGGWLGTIKFGETTQRPPRTSGL